MKRLAVEHWEEAKLSYYLMARAIEKLTTVNVEQMVVEKKGENGEQKAKNKLSKMR